MVSKEQQNRYWADFYAYYRSIMSLSCIRGDYTPSKREIEGEKRFWKAHRANKNAHRPFYLQKSKFRK